jgi:hypothetical protein
MQITRFTAKATALAALLALTALAPANATSPAPRDTATIPASAADIQAPSDDQVVELADRSMRVFMTSVRDRTMQSLWNHASPRLREKYSVVQLDEAFKSFYGLTITGDPLAGKSPVFSADPTIDANSNLVVRGFYTTSPSRVSFHLVYALEGRAWKLVGINVSATPTAAPATDRSSTADARSMPHRAS